MKKPRIAFCWLASCGGRGEAVVDLGEDLLAVASAVDIVFWPVALDFKIARLREMEDGGPDAAFVNRSVRTSEQLETARLFRRKARPVFAFGTCAHIGGVPGLAGLFDSRSLLDGPCDVWSERLSPFIENRIREIVETVADAEFPPGRTGKEGDHVW